jgi:hypothetical protein
MLEPQVVVNFLLKLAIGVDLVRHGNVKVFPAFTLSFGKFWPAWQKSYGRPRTRFRRSFRLRARLRRDETGSPKRTSARAISKSGEFSISA